MFSSPNDVNILVWGYGGAGKSSLINGMINFFRPAQPLMKFAPVQKTNTYTKYNIGSLLSEDKSADRSLKLNLWDTWGWVLSKKHMREVIGATLMIQGRVKPGTHMNEKTAVMETPDPSLRCHSVILVLLPEMRYDDALRGFVDEVVDLGSCVS